MKITRRSMFSGIEHTKDLDVTQDQLDRWQNGELIQNVMKHLTPGEREFIMTGVTDEEWDKEFCVTEGEEITFTENTLNQVLDILN